jgi:hypothetical protein
VDENLRHWHPTKQEVEAIVREVRPLIRDLARREQAAITSDTFPRPQATKRP